MKKLRKSSTLNLHFQTSDDISQNIRDGLIFNKAAGFDASDIGIGLFDVMTEGVEERVERAVEDSKEIGLRFEVCHLPFIGGGKSTADLDAFNKKMFASIDAAALLGVDYAVMHPNVSTVPLKQFNRRESYDRVMSHLSPFVEYANKVGLKVVVENMRVISGHMLSHRYCQTPDELCEVADALGIGVCWDFGHANISGVKQSEGLEYVGKRLKVIHVNDNAGVDDEHIPPFTGNVDWHDAMRGLELAGFDGLFNYEITMKNIPASVRKSFAAYLIEAADEIMSY